MDTTTINLLKEIVRGPAKTKELMDILGIKERRLNYIINDLKNQDYIEKEDSNVKLKENTKTVLFRDVAKKCDIEKFLHESNMMVVSYATEPIKIDEIVRLSGLSTATVYRAVSDLESIGVIIKKDDTVSIDSSKEPLLLFAKTLKTEREKRYEGFETEIIYKDEFRTLRKVPKGKITVGEPTSFSLFSDYGIEYQTPYDYYIQQDSSLKIEDVLIHSVLSAYKDNDKMGLIIAMVFYVKNKNKMQVIKLREVAGAYGIRNVWVDIEGYLRHRELRNKELFLPWDEFVSKAKLYDVLPERYTLPELIGTIFEEIGKMLTKSMTLYIIGGENMRIKNLKASTKDCDIVLENKEDFSELTEILINQLGYKKLAQTEYTEEDMKMNPDDILVHPLKSRIDLFTKRVMRGMTLSSEMIKNADFVDYGNLRVGFLRNEYVFLLKAVASREGDIQDMAFLVQGSPNQPRQFQHGEFDWEEVWKEILRQEHINHINNFTPDVFQQITNLSEQTRIVPPFLDKLRRHVLDILIKKLIRGGKISLKKIVTLLKGGDISEPMIRNRVDSLNRENIVKKINEGREVYVESKLSEFPIKNAEINAKNVEGYIDWRFPLRPPSSTKMIDNLVEELLSLNVNTIGQVDEIVIKSLNGLIEYEKENFPKNNFRRVGAVRICFGLNDAELGNNRNSNFYVSEFEKFSQFVGR